LRNNSFCLGTGGIAHPMEDLQIKKLLVLRSKSL